MTTVLCKVFDKAPSAVFYALKILFNCICKFFFFGIAILTISLLRMTRCGVYNSYILRSTPYLWVVTFESTTSAILGGKPLAKKLILRIDTLVLLHSPENLKKVRTKKYFPFSENIKCTYFTNILIFIEKIKTIFFVKLIYLTFSDPLLWCNIT